MSHGAKNYFRYQFKVNGTFEKAEILKVLEKQILIVDGAMGTMINKKLKTIYEKSWSCQKSMGNNDILNITKSEIIYEIHKLVFRMGS